MGALDGLKALEIGGIGPGPFCGMMLADMGADVLRLERPTSAASGVDPRMDARLDALGRGRRSLAIDLKRPAATELVLDLAARAEILFEGFRPGVMERLGLGPDVCLSRNPRLVYGRVTGWGQTGPLAQIAGHDINYIGLSGALSAIGRKGEKPVPPGPLVGDFGGGGMMLALGLLAGVIEARSSGRGQVVDASIVEGSSLLMAAHHSLRDMGIASEERGSNLFDSGAHFYETYETADGKHMAVGAIEAQFYARLVETLGLDADAFADQGDQAKWPACKAKIAQVMRSRTRDEWCAVFDGVDACVTPVLSPTEAVGHPHNMVRQSFVRVGNAIQPAPAPRFDRTPSHVARPPPRPGELGEEALADWGVTPDKIATLRDEGVLF